MKTSPYPTSKDTSIEGEAIAETLAQPKHGQRQGVNRRARHANPKLRYASQANRKEAR